MASMGRNVDSVFYEHSLVALITVAFFASVEVLIDLSLYAFKWSRFASATAAVEAQYSKASAPRKKLGQKLEKFWAYLVGRALNICIALVMGFYLIITHTKNSDYFAVTDFFCGYASAKVIWRSIMLSYFHQVSTDRQYWNGMKVTALQAFYVLATVLDMCASFAQPATSASNKTAEARFQDFKSVSASLVFISEISLFFYFSYWVVNVSEFRVSRLRKPSVEAKDRVQELQSELSQNTSAAGAGQSLRHQSAVTSVPSGDNKSKQPQHDWFILCLMVCYIVFWLAELGLSTSFVQGITITGHYSLYQRSVSPLYMAALTYLATFFVAVLALLPSAFMTEEWEFLTVRTILDDGLTAEPLFL
jgi:hypothetical protein